MHECAVVRSMVHVTARAKGQNGKSIPVLHVHPGAILLHTLRLRSKTNAEHVG
jgi:hypothetical protein